MSDNKQAASSEREDTRTGVSQICSISKSRILSSFSHSPLYQNMIVLIWVIKRIFYSIQINQMMIDNHHAQLAMKEKKIGHV